MFTLQRVEFDRKATRLGQMWALHKDTRTMICSLWNHPVGWELRLDVDGELIRSQACRAEREVFDTADAWKTASVPKGWSEGGLQ